MSRVAFGSPGIVLEWHPGSRSDCPGRQAPPRGVGVTSSASSASLLVREQLRLLAGSQSRSTSVDGGGPFADDFGRRRTVTGSACEHLSGAGSSEQVHERGLQVVFRTVGNNREELAYRGSFGFLFEPFSVATVCSAERPVLRVGLSAGRHMVMSSLARVGPARLCPACRTPRDL